MASNIFWLVVAATLLSLVTYCLFNPPGNRKTGALNRDHQARPRAAKFVSFLRRAR
jgi:hypothetical protein